MNDRTGRRKKDAPSAILFPLLFDIMDYLKGYAGGLVVFRRKFAYRPTRETDDVGVSFTV